MSDPTRQRLYDLLPAVLRVRDAAQGAPLEALLAVIEGELEVLEADVEGLYDNWFIETCAEWAVPYLGDLLGVRGLAPVEDGVYSQRALVANTLAYRRGKGTAHTLEQLARDVTGWPARVVEFFERLGTTQNVNHVRPHNLTLASLKSASELELVDGPFETAAHLGEVRHIDNGRGKYNIPNVGIFLWRLRAYASQRVTPRAAPGPAGRFTFSPLGLDGPLFNRPRTETEITELAGEINVPGPLRRRPLHDELTGTPAPGPRYFDPDAPVFQVFVQENPDQLEPQPLPSEEVQICNLSDLSSGDWRRPSPGKTVAVDPVLGRLSFAEGFEPLKVQVSSAYGFSGDLGGGPYSRRASVAAWSDRPATWQIGVTKNRRLHEEAADPALLVETLQEAIAAWNAHADEHPGAVGLIAVMDSDTYADGEPDAEDWTGPNAVQVPEGARLAIVAADWPDEERPGEIQRQRVLGRLVPDNRRPCLRGDLQVRGTAPAASPDPGELILDGLLLAGKLTVRVGNLGRLRLAHCTLVPAAGGLEVLSGAQLRWQNPNLRLEIVRSITGPLAVAETAAGVALTESIVDAGAPAGAALAAPAVAIESSTIRGSSEVRSLEASNSLFTAPVVALRRQTGCVRFCYLPPGSLVPRRYRCLPDDPATAGRVVPRFTSLEYGRPGYGQLAGVGPPEIAAGAEGESEMGAFRFLQQQRRLTNLRASLNKYLRFGLEAGVLFVT